MCTVDVRMIQICSVAICLLAELSAIRFTATKVPVPLTALPQRHLAFPVDFQSIS